MIVYKSCDNYSILYEKSETKKDVIEIDDGKTTRVQADLGSWNVSYSSTFQKG
jgi:hypothetical protein